MNHPAVVFVSRCPQCEREQPQNGFTVAALSRLLHRGHPIEAYCAICDEFWAVSQQKRVELAEVVAATCQDMALLKLRRRLRPNSREDEIPPS